VPGGGIQIKGWDLFFTDGIHDVVIRHVRFRPGVSGPNSLRDPTEGKSCVTVYGGTQEVYNVVFDHCSFFWAPAANVTVWGAVHDLTVQWSTTEGITYDFPGEQYFNSTGIIISES